MRTYSMIIGGRSVSPGTTFNVVNPADESVVAACPEGSPELVDEAVSAARSAFGDWAATPDAERAEKLSAIADLLQKHQAELSELVTREQGKTQSGPGANTEASGAVAWTRATAALTLPDQTIVNDISGKIIVRRRPVGVVASITPWNWPLLIAVWHVMPAIRTGCTVVIKPSPYTPLSTLRLVELMNRVLSPGVINVVTGGDDIGNRLTLHSDVNKIAFTGSVATGKKVMGAAALTLKRITLELGGNDAGIILPGTRIEPLLEKLFWGCFINAGQTCAALKRLYVHESQYEEVVAKFAAFVQTIPVGNGLDPKNLVGPISNQMQFDKVVSLVEDARARGARIAAGGAAPKQPGFFYPLTVVADATDEMRVVYEEQFGPVIPLIKYRTVDEAVVRANALDVGLGGSVWANDAVEGVRIANRLECGTVWVNQHGGLHPLAPFGGVKSSGIGVEFGVDGLREYTTIQVLNVAA
jgi:acyl-CoA reductase-like NAD-dependent aldehyde dehydrogenase